MTIKELERRLKRLVPPPMPTATIVFQDGHSETMDWVAGLMKAIEEPDAIASIEDSRAGLINILLSPVPNRNIEDYEE